MNARSHHILCTQCIDFFLLFFYISFFGFVFLFEFFSTKEKVKKNDANGRTLNLITVINRSTDFSFLTYQIKRAKKDYAVWTDSLFIVTLS